NTNEWIPVEIKMPNESDYPIEVTDGAIIDRKNRINSPVSLTFPMTHWRKAASDIPSLPSEEIAIRQGFMDLERSAKIISGEDKYRRGWSDGKKWYESENPNKIPDVSFRHSYFSDWARNKHSTSTLNNAFEEGVRYVLNLIKK